MNHKSYLFLLGNHPVLSRAELSRFTDEIMYDAPNKLLLADNVRFANPRGLPKSPEQIFLDRLGGTIWMAEVLGEYAAREDLYREIETLYTQNPKEGVQYLAANYYGRSKQFWPDFLYQTQKKLTQTLGQKVRIENPNGTNLDSGRIFNTKLLRKGHMLIIWQVNDSFLLAKVSALQNLRNYGLRDYGKNFRDAHMGMLPPKVAQILINLVASPVPSLHEQIVDPFCGSGTINGEAAIMGFSTVGSDLRSEHILGAQKNFAFLSEKFRFLTESGNFFTSDAINFPWQESRGKLSVVATEGWLGKNFTYQPSADDVRSNLNSVLGMWEKFFKHLSATSASPTRLSICLPAWSQGHKYTSISQKLFAKIKPLGYIPSALNQVQTTYLYHRPGAFVAREICVIEKINTPR